MVLLVMWQSLHGFKISVPYTSQNICHCLVYRKFTIFSLFLPLSHHWLTATPKVFQSKRHSKVAAIACIHVKTLVFFEGLPFKYWPELTLFSFQDLTTLAWITQVRGKPPITLYYQSGFVGLFQNYCYREGKRELQLEVINNNESALEHHLKKQRDCPYFNWMLVLALPKILCQVIWCF